MTEAISQLAKQSVSSHPATIYYAFKQSEINREGLSSTGWATFLQAVIRAGYAVVGTWPIRTERAARTIASGSNALANSVVLVCRRKADDAETIGRAEFIRALKRELPPAIADLQAANIAPADMPQAAIGPGMGVFSRCKAVLEADDSPMTVTTALQLINRELDEYLGDIQSEFDDETRFAVTWFEQHGVAAGRYGNADNIARARGISGRQRETCRDREGCGRSSPHPQTRRDRSRMGSCHGYSPDRLGMLPTPDPYAGA